jgi:hypothetical protein
MIGKELEDAVLRGDVSASAAVKFFSRAIIAAALHFFEGNIAATARALGVKRTSLSLMIERRMSLQSIVRRGVYQRQKRIRKEDVVCEECGCVLTSDACFGCQAIADAIYIASTYTSETYNYSVKL